MKHISTFEDFLNENKEEVENVINVLYAIEDEIWTKLNIKAGSQLYANKTTQQNFITMANQLIQSANIQKPLMKYAKKISDTLRADNYHSLNIFLGASGYYNNPKIDKYFTEIVQTSMPGYGWDAELFQK
jgi:hypothetical protein